MKPAAFLINVSRGGLVDEQSLCDALASGRLAGAGLDVLEQEPADPGHPLLQLPNVLLSSHAAYHSEEALEELRSKAIDDIVACLRASVRFMLSTRTFNDGGIGKAGFAGALLQTNRTAISHVFFSPLIQSMYAYERSNEFNRRAPGGGTDVEIDSTCLLGVANSIDQFVDYRVESRILFDGRGYPVTSM